MYPDLLEALIGFHEEFKARQSLDALKAQMILGHSRVGVYHFCFFERFSFGIRVFVPCCGSLKGRSSDESSQLAVENAVKEEFIIDFTNKYIMFINLTAHIMKVLASRCP